MSAEDVLTTAKLYFKESRKAEGGEIADEAVDAVYAAYPSKDVNNNNRSTHKSRADKVKIKALLKTMSPQEMIDVINAEVESHGWLKDFSTFLRHFPDPSETEKGKRRKKLKEIWQ